MVNLIRKIFSTTMYIQIWENRLRVSDIDSGNVFDEKPYIATDKRNKNRYKVIAVGNKAYATPGTDHVTVMNPFTHPRVLCGDFVHAEALIRKVIQQISKSKLIPNAPAVVIHPMEKLEGGLTDVELRMFRELGLGAGARDVAVHTGDELQISGLDFKEFIRKNE